MCILSRSLLPFIVVQQTRQVTDERIIIVVPNVIVNKATCKRAQQLLTLLGQRSRNKRNVGSCWLKSLTGFKLCATTPNNTQQHATGCANGRNM